MSATIRTLIVDDEPIARAILEGFVALLPQLKLVASCANAIEALRVLREEPIDLMLLDIDMPQINGLSLLGSLQSPPKVIFTTAYAQHAIESYEYHAVDYLLKPIRFERFLKAVNKLGGNGPMPAESGAAPQLSAELIFVKSEGRLVRIDLGEVLFIEGLKDYVAIHNVTGKLVIHSTMKAMEDRLSHLPAFLRIHKSYLVNLRHVREVDGNSMRIGSHLLSIGSTYRDAVQAALDQYRL